MKTVKLLTVETVDSALDDVVPAVFLRLVQIYIVRL